MAPVEWNVLHLIAYAAAIAYAAEKVYALSGSLIPRLLGRSILRRLFPFKATKVIKIEHKANFETSRDALVSLFPMVPGDKADVNHWFLPVILSSLAVLDLFAHKDFPFSLLGALHVSSQITLGLSLDLREPLDRGSEFNRANSMWRPELLLDSSRGTVVRVSVTFKSAICVNEYLFPGVHIPGIGKWLRLPPSNLEPWAGQLSLNNEIAGKWSRISQDYNPIHLSPLLARLFGFKGQVAHGMSVAMIALRRVDAFREMSSGTLSVNFYRPIILPSDCALHTSPEASTASIVCNGVVCTKLSWSRTELRPDAQK